MTKRRDFLFLAGIVLVIFWSSAHTTWGQNAAGDMQEQQGSEMTDQTQPMNGETAGREGEALQNGEQGNVSGGKTTSNLLPVEVNDRWGYISKEGRMVIPAQYEDAERFSEGMAPVRSDDRWGFINEQGKMVISPRFDQAGRFNDGLARVKVDGKWGYVDQQGQLAIRPQYDWAGDFKDGNARVKTGGIFSAKWTFIDKQGNYLQATPGEQQRDTGAAEERGGRTARRTNYDEAGDFSEGMAPVKVGGITGKWGFIDKQGNLVINPRYESVGEFSNGLAAVEVDGRWGYIDKKGSSVIKPQFGQAGKFSDEGLARVKTGGWIGGRFGYIDKQGAYVVSPQFNDAGDFTQGLARVKVDDDWGYIDKAGKFVIDPEFSDATDFVNGVARVRTGGVFGGKWHYINREGEIITLNREQEPRPAE
ncbi:MAG: WG repeat-containing protein [Phycisphaerae bacterium]|jgi:hypothetical protein|nr:WG repeat-containing protein [Phycisphaerae bacterium]